MLMEKVIFDRKPAELVVERLPNRVCRILLRRNIRPGEDALVAGWTTDEAIMKVAAADCPSRQELEEDFESWFDYAARWQPAAPKTSAQLQADIDYLAAMCGIELEA